MVVGELRLGVVQSIRPHPQVRHHLRREAVLDAVREERLDDGLHVEVEHPVGERGAHVVADGAVEAGVPGGDDLPAVGQPIVPDAPVEDQRVR